MRLTIVRKQNRRLAHLLWIGILFLSLSDCVSALDVKANQNDVQEKTAVELEEISAGIDQRLESIAEYNLRSGMGAIGYRSKAHLDAKQTEWFEVELESEQSIDEIVLVPNVLRDAQSNFVGDGFPVKLRVVFGTGSGPTRTTVDQIEVTHQSPRQIAPLIIPMKKAKASWVRIEATELSKRSYDDSYIFQFAEILVFAGHRNLALRQPVKVSSDAPTGSGAWGSSFAVDGFLPYLMNSATGQGALPFVSVVGIGKQPTLTIDLEVEAPVSRINLHLVEQSDTVPQSFSGDFGFPRQLKIEGASREDFSDAKVLSVTAYENSYQFGPIVLLQFKPHSCRFIKVTAVEPYFFGYPGDDVSETRIGFAEIEVFSEAENLALGKAVVANFRQGASLVSSITDGKNRYGPVIQIRDWMSELSERHSLETQRPLIAAELNKRYQKQRQNFKWLIGLATLLGLSAIIVGLVGWQLRERAVQKTREQIAANLHDELGANIHAMGLVSDMARASSNDPERLDQLMLRMRELSERAGKAAAHCANMLESEGLFDDLITDICNSNPNAVSACFCSTKNV